MESTVGRKQNISIKDIKTRKVEKTIIELTLAGLGILVFGIIIGLSISNLIKGSKANTQVTTSANTLAITPTNTLQTSISPTPIPTIKTNITITPSAVSLKDQIYNFFKVSGTWKTNEAKQKLSCIDSSLSANSNVFTMESTNIINYSVIDTFFTSNGWTSCGDQNGASSRYGTYKKGNSIAYFIISSSASQGDQTKIQLANY
jgi:hypothetical protein